MASDGIGEPFMSPQPAVVARRSKVARLTAPAGLRHYPLVFLLGRPVSGSRCLLQNRPVEDSDVSPRGPDCFLSLKIIEGLGNSGAPHGKHDRQVLVGHGKLTGFGPVLAHQQPTGEPFTD